MKLFRGAGIYLAGMFLVCSQVSHANTGRTDLSGPGEAEVVAGTGYTHTLFDSADNKCQHCHNDLYDTWKTSMHAKSWEDPIFQSKYQDFLRLQISKIGSIHPVSGIEYKPVMVEKAAQVCIKCHAPTAYYSNDYRLIVARVGDINEDPKAYEKGLKQEKNLAPAYNPEVKAVVSSMGKDGIVRNIAVPALQQKLKSHGAYLPNA